MTSISGAEGSFTSDIGSRSKTGEREPTTQDQLAPGGETPQDSRSAEMVKSEAAGQPGMAYTEYLSI